MNYNLTGLEPCLHAILDLSLKIVSHNGVYQTSIPFLTILKENQPTIVSQGVLTPSFCIVLQGRKKLQIGKNTIEYGPGNYLASSIDMPINGQVSSAAKEAPYVALRIELIPEEVASVALSAKIAFDSEERLGVGTFVGRSDVEVVEAFLRLLKLSEDPQAAAFLAPSVKREIIYRLLAGGDGELFYRNMLLHQEAVGISKVINWITANFDRSFLVSELAAMGNMSISSLHHKFKLVTTMGPLQYQKRLRLQEARRLLLDGSLGVTETALEVGYESSTQFIREYKRLYGRSPLRDIRAIREGS